MKQSTPPGGNAVIRVITAAETIPLRHLVLRPGRPQETARFPGDDELGARHLGAYRDGRLLAVASLFPVEMPERPGIAAFQLRGMAAAPEARNTGLGTALVAACVECARESGVPLLWCNARIAASEFYRRLGFETVGGEFQIVDVGPHFRMMLRVAGRV